MRDGVVPGGGTALLACRDVLLPGLNNAQDSDERAAYQIMLQALEAPFRTLMSNAGFMPGKILAAVEQAGQNYGYDVLTSQVVNMAESGIYDTAPVLKGAVHTAFSSAALALTTDAIIHLKNPPEALQT